MRTLWRPLLVIVLALLVPVVPFFAFGEALEARITAWLDPPPPPATIALATVGVLAVDILLPVPSSVVSTLAGAAIGNSARDGRELAGNDGRRNAGLRLGQSLWRPLAARLSSDEDLVQMDYLAHRYGAWLLVLSRPLPIVAEAAVLFLGTTSLAWRTFLPPVMLSNLGIALVYAVLGNIARTQGELPLAIAASIAIPVLAATLTRWVLSRKTAAQRSCRRPMAKPVYCVP